ncbi:DUF262 domain-containing protein [Patescibacteria group bacterium]|nr:DUF262 domain-containing protein [Patescibacteria group bacterium]MBZ9578233.1 DUF262 domain-containing protein [Patescibacteria group bacterium]
MSKKNKKKRKSKSEKRRSTLLLTVKEFINKYVYRIDLDADYQREKVWSKKEQELLLDSILRDIDIPKIYLAKVEGNKQFDFECIDGKQRMITLLNYFKPDPNEKNSLIVEVAGGKYTYKQLKKEYPKAAKKIENYELTFIIYKKIDDDLIREIFRRLQLGIRLNSGELLKTYTGAIRDFIYKEIGNKGPFFRYTKLSEKRFSRPFTLAQICINSFKRIETGDFVRARLVDIQDFFEDNYNLKKDDENLIRIKKVLKIMDAEFGEDAKDISSRGIAVTAYFFTENLYLKEKKGLIPKFVEFYLKLLDEIKHNMKLIKSYEKPENINLMEEFHKYILQASVEPYSIRRRHNFLKKAFDYYLNPETKGKIIGSK